MSTEKRKEVTKEVIMRMVNAMEVVKKMEDAMEVIKKVEDDPESDFSLELSLRIFLEANSSSSSFCRALPK